MSSSLQYSSPSDWVAVDRLSTETQHQGSPVPSLLNICLDFVAVNTHYVESLVGFPDVVGKTLFERAEAKDVFCDFRSDNAVRSLQLFSYAYGSSVVDSVNIENMEADAMVILPVISSSMFEITKLCLDGCGLGQRDDLLQHISGLKNLQDLSLRGNQLEDSSLRILTSPMRILKRGAMGLRTLDLSRNPRLTEASARYLLCFNQIELIDLSGTRYFCWGIQKLEDNLGLEEDADMEELTVTHKITNQGWAAHIIDRWAVTTYELPDKSLQTFYGKIGKSRYTSEIKRKKTVIELPPAVPIIRLRRSELLNNNESSHPDEACNPVSEEPPAKKKQRLLSPAELLEEYDIAMHKPPTKHSGNRTGSAPCPQRKDLSSEKLESSLLEFYSSDETIQGRGQSKASEGFLESLESSELKPYKPRFPSEADGKVRGTSVVRATKCSRPRKRRKIIIKRDRTDVPSVSNESDKPAVIASSVLDPPDKCQAARSSSLDYSSKNEVNINTDQMIKSNGKKPGKLLTLMNW